MPGLPGSHQGEPIEHRIKRYLLLALFFDVAHFERFLRRFFVGRFDLVERFFVIEREHIAAVIGLFVVIILAGILVGLALLVPAGMEHAAFQRAHPYVEDFYTDDDRAAARTSFSAGLVGGIALIFVGIGILLVLGEDRELENVALFFLMFFIALGVWNIVHYGMLLGRTNVDEYNRSVGEELEVEEIVRAQLDDARREALLEAKKRDEKIGAVCAVIMILATIVGLGLLFAPVLASPDPSAFDPVGTSAMWFWVAWPVGGLLCGVVAVLMRAFGRGE